MIRCDDKIIANDISKLDGVKAILYIHANCTDNCTDRSIDLAALMLIAQREYNRINGVLMGERFFCNIVSAVSNILELYNKLDGLTFDGDIQLTTTFTPKYTCKLNDLMKQYNRSEFSAIKELIADRMHYLLNWMTVDTIKNNLYNPIITLVKCDNDIMVVSGI